jgi:hypothetical protein
MGRSLRLVVAAALLAVLALGGAGGTAADSPKILQAQMVGIPAGAPTVHGIAGGGAPWRIDQSKAELWADGRVVVLVNGLTLLSGVNPIANGRAIVTCGGAQAASSPIVAFSPDGDAMVDAVVDLPSPCFAPAVFFAGVLPNGAERWFAVTGH